MHKEHNIEIYRYYVGHILNYKIDRRFPVRDHYSNRNPLGTLPLLRQLVEEAVRKLVYEKYCEVDKLTEVIADYEKVDQDYINITNGASQAIFNIFAILRPSTVLLQDLTYLDYLRVCKELSIKVHTVKSKVVNNRIILETSEILKHIDDVRPDLVVIVNPNNPTGVYMKFSDLLRIVEHCKNRNIATLIDLSFIDFQDVEQVNIDKLLEYDNVIIVKSYTKIFACSGMRIGVIMSRKRFPNQRWPLDSLTIYVFERLLRDFRDVVHKYIEKTRKFIRTERLRVLDNIREFCTVYDTDVHFFLIRSVQDLDLVLYERYRIIVRRYCELADGSILYRVSLSNYSANTYLINSLREALCQAKSGKL